MKFIDKNNIYLYLTAIVVVLVIAVSSFYIVRGQSVSNNFGGGVIINKNSAALGLLIPDGRVGLGLGTNSPTADFEVNGTFKVVGNTDFVFNDTSNPKVLTVPTGIETNKLEVSSLVHEEAGVTIQYIYGATNCQSCGETARSGNGSPSLLSSLFAVYPAEAAPACYNTCSPTDAASCSSLGSGWTEIVSERIIDNTNVFNTCAPGYNNGCAVPVDNVDYGSYIYRRTCQGPGGTTAEATKLEFKYDSGISKNTTVIHDNLQSPDNTLENCAYEAGPTCGNGKIMAGYNGSQIYCCEL